MKARLSILLAASALLAVALLAQTTVEVGSGAPSTVISQQFVNAFFRGNFQSLVSLPPVANVRTYGTTGVIQEFQDAARTANVRLALIKPNLNAPSVEGVPDVFQVTSPMFVYYNTVGVGTAGYPTMDTASCPGYPAGTCFWQNFDRSYALFAYSSPLANGLSTFATRNPFYTEWQNSGGPTTFGPAITAETAVTSIARTVGTAQSFQNGIIINITSGTLAGRIVRIGNPVYPVYLANGGPTGFLGFPTGPEQIVGTRRRQSFEGGAIEYEPGGAAVLRLPVSTVNLSTSATSLQLKLNETFTLEATPRAANGDPLLDRVVSWTTTNGRVVAVQSNGRTATLRAVGGGVATVTAVSEGRISSPVAISVQAPCCQIGEGAPNATAAQAFSDAITRNRLTIQLPAATPVRRAGAGYAQDLVTTGGTRLLVALADRSPQAWILSGSILGRYEELGGLVGLLGYPAADATPGGRQLFENGALAGNPVQLVSGAILARWALLGYETGVAGTPAATASTFNTFAGSGGVSQVFRDALILHIQSGTLANRTFLVTGAILRRYIATGGASGPFGAPTGDELTVSGRRRQDFEGGFFEYTPGQDDVQVTQNERRPVVQVLPATAVAGSRIRLSIGGFPDNARLQVSQTGQPDFRVQTRNGSYVWDAWVPSDSPSRTITVRAVDAVSNLSAQATYTIRAAADAQPRITKVRGDAQSGAPGTRLPVPLRVSVRDESGNALVGIAVTFIASPGAAITPRLVSTDINGEAEASLQLPPGEGVVLATAEAVRQVVTFSARATGTAISNFPRLTFAGDSYVGSAAAILRYFQDRGELGQATGAVSPAAIDSYLRNFCVLDNQANQICDGYLTNPETPNLWRLINFAGGGLELLPVAAADAAIREALATGTPVLLSLRMPSGDGIGVVATGVDGSGDFLLMDPSPDAPQSSLAGYRARGAVIAGALRFAPRAAASTGFLLIAAGGDTAVASPAGSCGAAFAIPRPAATAAFHYCDGSQIVYQAEITAAGSYRGSLTDLASGGSRFELNGLRAGSFRVQRTGPAWELTPLETSFQAAQVVNAASFNPDIAPGTAISIFGIGLHRAGTTTSVEINGQPARVLFATPFQINAALPVNLPAGSAVLRVTSQFGSAEAPVDIREHAPAIFPISQVQSAVTNQDGSLNTPSNPAVRGQVVVLYGTGFGAVDGSPADTLRRTVTPVTAAVGGVALRVVYAGLTPGAFGLYQVNVELPPDLPPGLFQSIELRQGGVTTAAIPLATR